MILVIDNYDSFTFNLVQYLGEMGEEPFAVRNDKITIKQMEKMRPKAIVISPGPCTPCEAGISNDVVRHFNGKIPILGVCLGHQCIGYVYGAKITETEEPVHGKNSEVFHDGRTLYKGLPSPIKGGRYHSLIIQREGLPSKLEITAQTKDRIIMGVRDEAGMVEGVQFHPESILTEHGKVILKNFLTHYRARS